MSLGRLAPLVLAALLAAVPAARAEPEQLRLARGHLEGGRHDAALALVAELDRDKLLATEPDLVESWRIRGLAYLYRGGQGDADQARAAFVALLSIDPDYALDPIFVTPLALAVFESVREEHAATLAGIRERRRGIAAQSKALAEEKRLEAEARQQLLDQEERSRKERTAPGSFVLQRVDRHSFLTNFLPFGAPQLEQDRSQVGALLAIGQGLGIAGTVLTYSQVRSYVGQDGKVATDDLKAARGWRTANWIVFGATAALYLGGMLDAVLHYEEETISSTTVLQEPAPAPRPQGPSAGLFLAPLEGGGAAGIAGRF